MSVLTHLSISTGGRLYRFHAQPKRTRSGEGCQEEGGALRAACREGGVALSLHCDPWPWQGPYQHWCGRLDDANERLFFYTIVITFVIIPKEYVSPSTRDLFFMETLMGEKQQQTNSNRFCPNTVTAFVRSYTLYFIYAILTPVFLGAVWVMDTHGGGWWWETRISERLNYRTLQRGLNPGSPFSVSRREKCWISIHTVCSNIFVQHHVVWSPEPSRILLLHPHRSGGS